MRFYDEVDLGDCDEQLVDLYERMYELDERVTRIETTLKNIVYESLVSKADKKIDILAVLQKEFSR
ncbi:MAG: hypothetical protein LBE18_01345 [Planctomycetaceae bacterium]|jgi:hypothetical protein|nr:hypothetical protein [Planctomycetaceae bacterium]